MKVVHIITGLSQGGAESALYRLVTYDHLNDHIVISLIDNGVYGDKMIAAGIPVYTINMERGKFSFSGFRRIKKCLLEVKPDIVQTWMYHADLIGGLAAYQTGFKNICWGIVNYNLSASITPLKTRVTARLCALFSRIVPRIIISCSQRAISVHKKIGYSKSKFKYIPLGFDMSICKYEAEGAKAFRERWGVKENEMVLGCVARWDPQKDHKNLIKAFQILDDHLLDMKLVFVGTNMNTSNDTLMGFVGELSDSRQSQIVMTGVVDRIQDVMSAFDLHVLPSLGEAFPNVLAEAMSCTIPCISTDVGDASVIVGDTGWIVPPGDAISLANAIEMAKNEFSNSNEDWQARKQNARKRIEDNYTMNTMIKAYNECWNNLGKGKVVS